jgi:outer membrane protein OmpA-like peptidoglycan-associated protein
MQNPLLRRSLFSVFYAFSLCLTLGLGVATAAPVPQEVKPSHVGSITTAGTECVTFLTDDVPEGLAVVASRQALQVTFGTGDAIFIEIDTADRPEIGDELEVVRTTSQLSHPNTGDGLGTVIEQLAVVRVLDVAGSLALARVENACREIQIGDTLRPFTAPPERPVIPDLPPFDPIHLIEPDDSDAIVVLGEVESVRSFRVGGSRAGVLSRAAYAQRDLVTIDQGESSGWEYGDIGLIYSGSIPETYGVRTEVPPLIIARGVIIHSTSDKALLKITDSDDVVETGAAVRNLGTALTEGGGAGEGFAGNRAPMLDCRAERSRLRLGESVRVSADVTDPDGDETTVTWTATAGRLDPPQGEATTWSSAGASSGQVTITGLVEDEAGSRASCALVLSVIEQPVSAEPTTLSFDCQEFALGSAEVDNRCKAVLDEVALRMRQNPQSTAEVSGFSDSTGSADRIQSLSEERAANVRTYLVETLGINASRVTSRGLGASDPIAADDTPEGRAKNRRVHILLRNAGIQ